MGIRRKRPASSAGELLRLFVYRESANLPDGPYELLLIGDCRRTGFYQRLSAACERGFESQDVCCGDARLQPRAGLLLSALTGLILSLMGVSG